ncbi:hypothetical protein BJL95_16035 [Methylomonas sp. LWB]|uniref:hypothetical protein n=1 Tax=Methylomonas sp. LWB TaxID=1905845 RepID=UPI0008DA24B1|nr:hypothetical protein [Methylomonas sp. LWB]OHX35723.1 hypothetical protein BJL95_16035 [Methylomonas sp. LWB]
MRKKIVRRAGKVLLQSSIYITLAGTMSFPASGWADGWTHSVKVTNTRPYAGGFLVYLDPKDTINVNACSGYDSSWPGFLLLYPASGVPTEAQKVFISQISLAVATGKVISIYSAACVNDYNSIDQIILNAN